MADHDSGYKLVFSHSKMVEDLFRGFVRESWVLLEFQSTPNPFMAVRLLSYVSLLYSCLMRANAVTPQDGLPAVISMVLYNGKGPWKAATDWTRRSETEPPNARKVIHPQP